MVADGEHFLDILDGCRSASTQYTLISNQMGRLAFFASVPLRMKLVNREANIANISIASCIAYWADRSPDKRAISDETSNVTWRELDRRTNRLAREFQARGVQAGDFVTIALKNEIAFYEATIATWKLGATPHPISWRLPKAERDAILDLMNPRLIVGLAASDVDRGIAVLPDDYSPQPEVSDAPLDDHTSKYWKALGSGGSTGRPKIIVSKTPGAFDPLDPPNRIEPEDALLVAGPLYHNASFMFSAQGLFAGCHIVVMPRFDPIKALQLIDQYAVNWVAMVPTMMQRIARLPDSIRDTFSMNSLRVLFHTGAICPIWLKEFWIDWLGAERIHEGYGGTEGCGGHWISGEEWLAHKGSVGRSLEEFEVRIIGPDGEALPPGEIGDIYSRPRAGAGSTYYYVGATPNRREDGFECIGDMGFLDAEGYLYIADRRTDLIISGGANIYPAEIEAIIDTFPGIRASAVIGLPDEDMGAVAHAILECSSEVRIEDLKEYLSDQLVSYKLPRSYEFVNEPIKDEAGKVRRSKLRSLRLK